MQLHSSTAQSIVQPAAVPPPILDESRFRTRCVPSPLSWFLKASNLIVYNKTTAWSLLWYISQPRTVLFQSAPQLEKRLEVLNLVFLTHALSERRRSKIVATNFIQSKLYHYHIKKLARSRFWNYNYCTNKDRTFTFTSYQIVITFRICWLVIFCFLKMPPWEVR